MKRVGIMSMQRIYNYGSSLQAYGLRRLIEGLSDPVDVSFLDFAPGRVLLSEGVSTPTSTWGRAVSKVAEYNAVDARLIDKIRFFNHKRTYGKRNFPLIGVTAQPNNDRSVDVQVIGSDEVFNCVQSNTRVGYSRDLFGHASPAGRVISYAASFGNTTLDKIESAGIRDELAADLAEFSAISVRDRNSARIIEALTGRVPTVNVDPALAYDYMSLEPRIPRHRLHDDKYLIVYGYSGRLAHDENVVLRQYARSIGARILSFGGVQECSDEFVDCNPFELLAYFRDAEAVITDTFHGTIFSIINRRPFGTIIRRSAGHGYGNEEKLGYLLEMFGLSGQVVTSMDHVGDLLEREIDFDSVGSILVRERASTRDYLMASVLGGEQR